MITPLQLVKSPIPDLGFDSEDYSVLWTAALKTASLGGLTCEIGVRLGGSTEIILRASETVRPSRPHIAIDPYGNLPYKHGNTTVMNPGYDDEMRRGALTGIYQFAEVHAIDVLVIPFQDKDFFRLFSDGVPLYLQHFSQTLWNEYSLVHFDGPHDTEIIASEIDFFASRMVEQAMWVFDDTQDYNHNSLEPKILHAGFGRLQVGISRKVVYQKNA